jgi:hypothetical protein
MEEKTKQAEEKLEENYKSLKEREELIERVQ